MAVTPKGIYYPTGDDAANWATIFQTMANSIDSALGDFTYDSGWIPVTRWENGWESYYTGTVSRAQYRKISNVVVMSGLIRRGAPASIITTMPEGFKPDRTCRYPVTRTATEIGVISAAAPSGTLTWANDTVGSYGSFSGVMYNV